MSEIERWKEVSELGKKSIMELIKANEKLESVELENAELLAWKESALRELSALDLQSLGAKLGIGLGQSVSENIHTKVDSLLERVKELEGENFNLAAHQCDNWKPEENGDWSCGLQSQLAEYRQALERILQGNCSPIMVAKEALKKQ